MLKRLSITSVTFFIVVFAFVLSTRIKASAQSFSLTPSSGTVNIGSNLSIEVKAVAPPSTNAASIKISIPALATIQSWTAGSGIIDLAGSGCSAKFTASYICVDVASGSNFTNGQTLGTIVIEGVTDGVANMNFVTGTQYATGAAYTGTGGTYTIGAGGGDAQDGGSIVGTLPSTALSTGDKVVLFGVLLIIFGILVYQLNIFQTLQNYFNNRVLLQKKNFEKSALTH